MKVLNKLTRGMKLGLTYAKQHIDIIEMVVGDVLIVAGMVSLYKNAQGIVEAQEEIKADKQFVKDTDEEIASCTDNLTWEDAVGESRNHYIMRTGLNHVGLILKPTWKCVVLVGGGMALNGLSNATVHQQLNTVSMALASTSYSFNEYRKRVREDVGEDKDYEYFTGTVKTVDVSSTGEVVKETTLPLAVGQDYIPHSFFLSTTSNYTKNPKVNLDTVEQAERNINRILEIDGVIFENDMRKMFGADRTVAGQTYVAYYKNIDGTTNHISVGLRRNDSATKRFKEGVEPDFLVTLTYDDGRELDIITMARAKDINWQLF